MNFVSYYCPNLFYENSQINEWILCDERLSLNHKTFGKLEALPEKFDAETFSIEADRLITESQFLKYIHLIKDFYYLGVRRFRIKDIGILNYFAISEHLEQCPEIQFIINLELGGHHNYESISYYEKKYSSLIEKIIICTEITFDTLSAILDKIRIPVEIYGLGPILLFYTPRKLLNNQIKEEIQNLSNGKKELIAVGTSLESPHSGFDIIQNQGGTLMYAPNHFCLLDYIDRLAKIGIHSFRIDMRSIDNSIQMKILKKFIRPLSQETFNEFRKVYPVRVLKGLFVVNKSKVLFKKLKNKTLENIQNHHALVVEVAKNSHMLVKQTTEVPLRVRDRILIQSPDGREKRITLKWIKDLSGQDCECTYEGRHYIVDNVPGISIKSKITILSQ